ncbi:hypothetical protein ACOMHN_049454 [Nucella lapillus]
MCRVCAKPCQVVKKEESGTSVKFSSDCQCGNTFTWLSQPYSRQLPLVNLVLAAAAFFTACSPTRLLDVFRYSNIACFSMRTYSNIQGAYLVPAVRNVWQKCQDHLFLARRGRTLKLAGDGRCDSPGHCAKYCSYTLMDAETAHILQVQLVQSNQVRNSHAMELEGLKTALANMTNKVCVSHLITDRHSSIKKYVKDHHGADDEHHIVHHFDIWHMAKGIGKKLEAAGKSKRNAVIGLWSKGIKRHMYWCSTSTPEGPDRQQVVKDKWLSIINHIADIHEGHGGTFSSCLHGALEPRAWIRRGTRQHETLRGIISSKFLLKDIGMLSPDVQTACLESYHAVVCHFAPKLYSFSYPVMESKLLLAAMHFNANAGRKQAVTEGGDLQWKISRPKSTKGAAVPKPVKEKLTKNYMNDLFEEVVLLRLTYPSYKRAKEAQQEYRQTVPLHLSQTAPHVDKKNHCCTTPCKNGLDNC